MRWLDGITDLMDVSLSGTPGAGDGQEWVNLIKVTIISTTVGKNPLEEME